MRNQKFKKYEFVTISSDHSDRLYGEHKAIVAYSYAQQYGHGSFKDYSLYILKSNRIINHCSWYTEKRLKKSSYQNKILAQKLIEKYEKNFYNLD